MACTIVKCSVVPSKTTIKSNKTPKYPKYLEFAETLNGRAAMQGIVWGGVNAMMTGDTLIQQISKPMDDLNAVWVTAIVAAGSAFTLETMRDESYWSFTPEAEIKNGRAAMVGFSIALLLSAAMQTQ